MSFNRQELAERAAALATQGVYVGASSWKYPGWCGMLYDRARQIAVFTGLAIILVISWFTVPWLAAPTLGQLLAVGFLWLALMLAFEVGRSSCGARRLQSLKRWSDRIDTSLTATSFVAAARVATEGASPKHAALRAATA